ncbi:putative membrane protein [Bacillus fengqiuensis]|nr:putative membrane protein [Bacillus fengqiuensis]
MFRVIILLGFTFVFMHLHATGNISKYVNMKYSWISFSTIFLLFFLTIAALYFYMKEDEQEDGCAECGCDHEHHHSTGKWKKWISYPVYIFPVVTALFFPVATLNSDIVEAKGFHFPMYDNASPYEQHQFLQPDTSVYYGKEGYDELMGEQLPKYTRLDKVTLNDDNFLTGMEILYNHTGEFMDKTIEFKGFTFHTNEMHENQFFVFRFGVIHCVADSGVFGMLVEFPEGTHFENDEWVSVQGTISTMYYQPFKKTIPILKVTDWKNINEPSDPYVYRNK